MASDATTRAAEALLAYRRGAGPADLRARDLCRRLADAVTTSGTVGPHTTNSPAFLTLGLELVANRDPEVRALIEALAAAVAGPPADERSGVTQTVHVTGSGNTLNLAGRDLHVPAVIPRHPGASERPRPAPPEPSPSSERADPAGRARFTVLFAAACPDGMPGPRVDREERALREALDLSGMRDQIQVETRLAVRPREFARALISKHPRVVHFAGHGSDEGGELLFEDELGEPFHASPEGLQALFAQVRGVVECALLNACYSRANSAAILTAVPYVIGMDGPLHDETAMAFTSGFYQGLGEGMTVPQSYDFGCAMLKFMKIEGAVPVLDTAPWQRQ